MRHEFSKQTKRAALKRSDGLCEATGEVYGLEPGKRCHAPLARGVEFDHYPIAATEPDSDGIENCVACCKACHKHKTRTFDVPMQAKSKRVSDIHLGIRNAPKMQGRSFAKSKPQRRATTELEPKFEGDILTRKATL